MPGLPTPFIYLPETILFSFPSFFFQLPHWDYLWHQHSAKPRFRAGLVLAVRRRPEPLISRQEVGKSGLVLVTQQPLQILTCSKDVSSQMNFTSGHVTYLCACWGREGKGREGCVCGCVCVHSPCRIDQVHFNIVLLSPKGQPDTNLLHVCINIYTVRQTDRQRIGLEVASWSVSSKCPHWLLFFFFSLPAFFNFFYTKIFALYLVSAALKWLLLFFISVWKWCNLCWNWRDVTVRSWKSDGRYTDKRFSATLFVLGGFFFAQNLLMVSF